MCTSEKQRQWRSEHNVHASKKLGKKRRYNPLFHSERPPSYSLFFRPLDVKYMERGELCCRLFSQTIKRTPKRAPGPKKNSFPSTHTKTPFLRAREGASTKNTSPSSCNPRLLKSHFWGGGRSRISYLDAFDRDPVCVCTWLPNENNEGGKLLLKFRRCCRHCSFCCCFRV